MKKKLSMHTIFCLLFIFCNHSTHNDTDQVVNFPFVQLVILLNNIL